MEIKLLLIPVYHGNIIEIKEDKVIIELEPDKIKISIEKWAIAGLDK